jgi:phi13 family phage major tail protein
MTLGLKDLYYAVITMTDGVETYGTPKKMAEAMTAGLTVNVAEAQLYADDALSESVKEFTSGELTLGIKELAPEVVAELLGQKVDENKVVWAGDDEAPFVAVGFCAKKTGGKYKYVWLQRVQFAVPEESYETKGESINFQTPKIKGTIYKTIGTGKWKADYVGVPTDAVAAGWFSAVKTYTAPTTAP